ncbi:MAG: tRNA (adenosine(37)-N6)-dimethylallyltransferase MiaA [Flavobacteriales bacterium]|nr:tRNA (adenosine(37)-N6)-dimethylallyltransferase MiaA [Flavobacteriales bacterium]
MPHLIIIGGPTASGKTAVAVEAARLLKTELVNADSRQVYKEMFIGTARPTEEELKGISCHLTGHRSIHTPYTTADFEQEALNAISSLHKEHEHVVMAGGTGLYIQAICDGLDPMPDVPETIREDIQHQLETEGIESLQKELLEKDPVYHAQVDLQNPRRLIRALEVCRASGKPYSSFRKKTTTERPFRITRIALLADREELYQRIDQRVNAMMEKGLLNEAESLFEYRTLPAVNTIGYRELFLHLEGHCSLDEAVEKIKLNTRHYAKRQMTWFRNDGRFTWMYADEVMQRLES